MNVILNPYALILSVSGLATIIMSIIIYSRLKAAEKSFALVIGLAGWWAITYSCELFSSTLSSMFFWIKVEYLGIVLLPPALLYFITVFISKQKLIFKLYNAWIFIVPVLTVYFVFTNDANHLFYKSLTVEKGSFFSTLKIVPAFWYYAFTIYFYTTIAWSIYSLVTAFKSADQIYIKQKNTILYALVVPWIFNILYKFGISPHQNIDLTPFAFIATSIIITFGLLRYKLLDIIPAAREKIFDSMQDAVLVLDAFDMAIDKNMQMSHVLQTPTDEIIGARLKDLFPDAAKLHAGVAERSKTTIEIEVAAGDTQKFYEVDINVLSDRKSDYSGCILIFNNITQRKNDATTLIALNDLKNRLFSIIAHDLRSPLVNIIDMIAMVDEKVMTEDEFKHLLPELSKSLNYTSGLLDNLLHWSKSQLKGEIINSVKLDIAKIVQHEIAYYQQKATEKGIFLSTTIEQEMWVFADAEMMRLVIRNLVVNAIKYCVNEDHIIVSATKNIHNEAIISIKDTGSGIKPEIVEKLFKLQTYTTRGTNNERGTGLGLQLCKDFIEKNKGRIWVTTEIGLGSTFYFTIPLAHSKSASNATVTAI